MTKQKANLNSDVTEFLEVLNHPFRKEIEVLRNFILSTNINLTENIKWNGPNYCIKDEDRITMRIQPPKKQVQLIFHRGAKMKDNANFVFEDPSGLMHWITKDRATVTFTSMNDIDVHEKAFAKLIKEWLIATKE